VRALPSRSWLRLPALAWVVLSILTACHKTADPGPALVVQSEISPQPAKVGFATIMILLSDLSSKPVSGATIVLEADMSHAGMAPVFGGSTEVAPGRYSGNLAFSMAGDWVVLLHMTLPNGARVERQIEVKGVRAK
jgi:succinate-acetate transporter protein